MRKEGFEFELGLVCDGKHCKMRFERDFTKEEEEKALGSISVRERRDGTTYSNLELEADSVFIRVSKDSFKDEKIKFENLEAGKYIILPVKAKKYAKALGFKDEKKELQEG